MKRSDKRSLILAAAGLGAVVVAAISYNAYFSDYNVCLRDALERGAAPLNAKIKCRDQTSS